MSQVIERVLVEQYLTHGGLRNLLRFENKQALIDLHAPSWIDTLKKGKSRVCYASNLGTLELLFEGQKLLIEHYDFQKNELLEEGSIVLQSNRFYCGTTLGSVRQYLVELALNEISLSYIGGDCALALENGTIINFVEDKLCSMSVILEKR